MPRAFLTVLDSVGCGGATDADHFGDEGANTLGNLFRAPATGSFPAGSGAFLELPNLVRLGLGASLRLASGRCIDGEVPASNAIWGVAEPVSPGKDTLTGHWELAGVPLPWSWHVFPRLVPAFPEWLLQSVSKACGSDGTLANCHSSGTEVIEKFGAEHLRTARPICYTSADSVFQIAAHEERFGLGRLYRLCDEIADVLHGMKVGRVIARPFAGDAERGFFRTSNRRDYSYIAPEPTLLDRVVEAGGTTHAVGKINDIFAERGISFAHDGRDDMERMDRLIELAGSAPDGSLVVANFVEFDTLFGHRRDPEGYAGALMRFDRRIPEIFAGIRRGDLLVFTADHGNDPTWRGTDHTRERVPILASMPGTGGRCVGIRRFADIGETVAAHLGLAPGRHGEDFLSSRRRQHEIQGRIPSA